MGRIPDKNEYYGQEDMGADETAFAYLKNCGKYVARHGVGMQRKRDCGDILPESVKMEEYDMVAILTHKNDERRSRKPHMMEA